MSERYRLATPEDLPQVARLVAHSFAGRTVAEHEAHLAHGPWGGVEALWVMEEAGRVAAACQLLPLRQWIGGLAMPVMGLGTVTVAPTHRRRGVAGRLVASGLQHARSRGDLASALYPFRIAFYAQMGYGLAGEALQYRLPPDAFPDAPERGGVALVQSEEERAQIRALYARWAALQTGQLRRTDAAWARALDGDDRVAVAYHAPGGGVEGYAVARYVTGGAPAERFLSVEERAWTSDAGRRAIYAWLGSLGDQWQHVLYRAHPAERLAERLREPRLPPLSAPHWQLWFPAAVLLRGPMFRLLDVPAALQARPTYGIATLALQLQVEDEQLPQNSGLWRLVLEEGQPQLLPGEGAADASLRLSAQTLSRLYIGALTPSEAVDAGLALLDRPEAAPRLDQAFRLPRPWTFDAF